MPETTIIALDDDPTGSQTVHSCLLLTRWDTQTLKQALEDDSPLFFVLTNTRAMEAEEAARVTREVCQNLKRTLEDLSGDARPINPLVISRSDSTLRGHYPVETDVIAEELGPFDACFLVPAFVEAGRITRDSVHYVVQDGHQVPSHETEFARDSVFAYRHSFLPAYVEEKTRGRIPADRVERFVLDDLRGDLRARLKALQGNACCVVDAERQPDLDHFAEQVLAAAALGKRFLFRSAASIITSLAKLPPQPVASEHMAQYVRGGRPGAVIVGSHVEKSTRQLKRLLEEPGTLAVEVDVTRVPKDRESMLLKVVNAAERAHAGGKTPVIFTSRNEIRFDDRKTRLAFGADLSAFLMDIVRRLPIGIGYLISKGGITSNDVLSKGLALHASRLLGQILTGCSVVRCPEDHPRYPRLPVVIFPGNVGDADALAEVYRRLDGAGVPSSGQARA
jgi:uncharacterized protein YgbK (DUF1537 family)